MSGPELGGFSDKEFVTYVEYGADVRHASLTSLKAALDSELVLVTGDNDLAGAALSLGMSVALTR